MTDAAARVDAPSLPPLLYAVTAARDAVPFEAAIADARAGVDAGAVT